MVKILVAPDKFKGSLTAQEACDIISNVLLEKYPDASITTVPLADGGEGTSEVLNTFFECRPVSVTVQDPLCEPVEATYGFSADKNMAIIEMASASGLQLLPGDRRNPMYTTTFGTGQLIADALNRGVQKIILGIGGSATNDAGMGMAAALGYLLLDEKGKQLKPTGENLVRLSDISVNSLHPRLEETKFITLCDVDNPLHGPEGAAFVYAPQKGASKNEVVLLDDGLKNFERVIRKSLNKAANFKGAGAAGGLGAGTKIFLNADIRKGIDFIINTTALENKIAEADIVITGEGKLDAQSLSGKVVIEVSRMASHFKKPVIVLCGRCELSHETLLAEGISQCITLADDRTPAEDTMQRAGYFLRKRILEDLSLENM